MVNRLVDAVRYSDRFHFLVGDQMATATNIVIQLSIKDVWLFGSVREAIFGYCRDQGDLVCGDSSEMSADQIVNAVGGSWYFVDAETGRTAEIDDRGELLWSDTSGVCLVCPSVNDAVLNPTAFAEMLAAVREVHSAKSDLTRWNAVASAIKDCAAFL